MRNIAEQTGLLFGSCWPEFTKKQYEESVNLFTKRALANNFDLKWIEGKYCLDAGCGGGRYSVALSAHGAKKIIAMDISKTGIKEASERTKDISNISYVNASVLDIPFQANEFDFVWSAGVIHHTTDFNKALSELSRVNKSGGKLFLLIYGSGGLRWKAIKSLRPIVVDLGDNFLSNAIDEAGLPANNKYHFRDDLTVPIQKLTSKKEIIELLKLNNYENIERWEGETFDHESSCEKSLDDLRKQLIVCKAMIDISTTPLENCLSKLCYEISQNYVNFSEQTILDKNLTEAQKKEIIIGQGNHRITANKK
ncbi:class I SAM-dependent methyltransferase [Prochlorococcus marinus]|uniref:class I SAM-dependent methyltransferase n=1 Tax=Prochlorococcus marinus TaxID=1219 RepID=UPI001ADD1A74|nr:class I SAM-dependent methyltransferase [Prochlorococcus marinus]MBO8217711.1 class I SAM-dependent methyltransferase [Prochlorococcus marinus XMU1405]MBW3040874.1 hypothetical protein [Prochlorococcus marinus str. MU1405]MBW3048334.1 hypothetical protein [Prochlorococcus marinus str. MU1406]